MQLLFIECLLCARQSEKTELRGTLTERVGRGKGMEEEGGEFITKYKNECVNEKSLAENCI